jgi:hypothetical protein
VYLLFLNICSSKKTGTNWCSWTKLHASAPPTSINHETRVNIFDTILLYMASSRCFYSAFLTAYFALLWCILSFFAKKKKEISASEKPTKKLLVNHVPPWPGGGRQNGDAMWAHRRFDGRPSLSSRRLQSIRSVASIWLSCVVPKLHGKRRDGRRSLGVQRRSRAPAPRFAFRSRVLPLRRPDARWGDDRRHRTETRDRKMTRQFKNHPNSYSAALGRAIL